MMDYNKAVGTAGTMTIRDDGAIVSFIISCTDPQTYVGSYTWSGVVNGVSVGGTASLNAGFGSRVLGSWSVGYSQTVTFHQDATGTQGLGGAADHAASISRGPAPTIPEAPHAYPVGTSGLTEITFTSMRYSMQDGSDGGSPITSRACQYSTTSNFSSGNSPIIGLTTSGTHVATGLKPGTRYYWRSRVQNAVGVSPWSAVTSAATLGGVNVSDGTKWSLWVVDVSNGSQWVRQAVEVSNGSTWKPAG